MIKLILFVSLLLSNFHSLAQGSIGWSENQIREEYSSQPNTEIYVKYIDGEKNLTVINYEATATFCINPKKLLCTKSMIKFKRQDLLTKYVTEFNNRYTVIIKGNSWETVLRGHLIKIELSYSTKLQANIIVFYEVN